MVSTISETSPARLLQVTRSTMEAGGFCFLITLAGTQVRARLMQPFPPERDLTVWLATSPRCRKVAEIGRHDQVTLAYADVEHGAYVTLAGKAEIETNSVLRQKYWREEFSTFWPDGPAGEDYVLIRFVPSRIELVNDAEGIAPEPRGLRAAVLIREDGEWIAE